MNLPSFPFQLAPRTPLYPVQSRYAGVETATHTDANGQAHAYLRRRFVPMPSRFVTVGQHVVVEGDRPDTLAARHLGDPEQYFRLCDAGGVLHPAELTEVVGRAVRLTLPEGIPGPRDA